MADLTYNLYTNTFSDGKPLKYCIPGDYFMIDEQNKMYYDAYIEYIPDTLKFPTFDNDEYSVISTRGITTVRQFLEFLLNFYKEQFNEYMHRQYIYTLSKISENNTLILEINSMYNECICDDEYDPEFTQDY